MRVFSADGVLLGEFGEERRNFVPIAQIPKVMQDAVLAVEDARFYQHSGVDYVGVIRAGLANFGEARSAQGASTITMQVARNFYLSTEKTFTRKIYEMLLSLKIESLLTKDQILEVYMNQICARPARLRLRLGQRDLFRQAAEGHHHRRGGDARRPAEGAVGLQPDRQSRARDACASATSSTACSRTASSPPSSTTRRSKQVLRYRAPAEVAVHAEYVAETARQMIFNQYGAEAYTRGLNVYLTLELGRADARLPRPAQGHHGLRAAPGLSRPRGLRRPAGRPKRARRAHRRSAAGLPRQRRAAAPRSSSRRRPKKVVAVLQNGEAITITGDGLKPAASALAAEGQPEDADPPRRRRPPDPRRQGRLVASRSCPRSKARFVALDPRTGAVRAMVGGFDYSKSKFNHVTQAWRQPGSSFKPFIYSAALEKGFTPATVINDAPLFFDAGTTGSQPWEPKNYDGKFDGPMSMRRGLAKSKNMISIRILQVDRPAVRAGVDHALRLRRRQASRPT